MNQVADNPTFRWRAFNPLTSSGFHKDWTNSDDQKIPLTVKSAETILTDKWFVALSEPVRTKKPLPVGAMLSFTVDPKGLTLPEVTTVDKWFAPLSEPVRVKAPLPVGAMFPHWYMDYKGLTLKEVTTVDRWYIQLSEPVRTQPPRYHSQIGGQAPFQFPFIPEVIPVDKWFVPLSEPVRTKKPLPVGAMLSFTVDPVALTLKENTTVDKWYIQLSEPVRKLPLRHHTLSASGMAPFQFGFPSPPPEVITLDKWYAPFSEPVKKLLPRDRQLMASGNVYLFPAGAGSNDGIDYVNVTADVEFPIVSPNYIRSNASIATHSEDSVQAAATVIASGRSFVQVLAQIAINARQYVRTNATVEKGDRSYIRSAATVAKVDHSYVMTDATIATFAEPGVRSRHFPDNSFVKTAAWVVIPGGSVQSPGTTVEDFLSSQIASNLYSAVSRFKLTDKKVFPNGIYLIITGFTSGVVSYQTRTRQWLRRVDVAPGGVLVSTEQRIQTLATGEIVTTTTETTLNEDVTTVKVTTQHSKTPQLTTTQITQKNSSGNQVTREISTVFVNGTKKTTEKKTVLTVPPDKDNIQPIKVQTLDGVTHYQFFGNINPEWFGGEAEGTSTTSRSESTAPGQDANGNTTNSFGQPIIVQTVDEQVSKPDGSVVNTHTETAGITTAGTTTTDTETQFNGITKKTITTVKAPDGGTTVTQKTENLISGDSVETTTDTVTDAFGQITTTITIVNTVTAVGDDGQLHTTITRTTKVIKGDVTLTETTVTIPNNFEDDIINKKVKVFMIREFTLSAVIDEMNYQALLEKHFTHQVQYAKLELFGQQLGNANLSFDMRQILESQFDQALDELDPISFEALGRVYQVVFAPSASAFRGKYVVGAEPHVYELQIILQERTDLVLGANGKLQPGDSGIDEA